MELFKGEPFQSESQSLLITAEQWRGPTNRGRCVKNRLNPPAAVVPTKGEQGRLFTEHTTAVTYGLTTLYQQTCNTYEFMQKSALLKNNPD